MPMPSQQQPYSPHALTVVTPTPVQDAQPLDKSTIIATVLNISPPCAGDPALSDVPLSALTGHRETTEAGSTGPAAACAQADHPAKVGSLVDAFPTVPAKASVPTTAPP